MERKQKIIELREKGMSFGSIGKIMNVSKQRVYQIYQDNAQANPDKLEISLKIKARDDFECQWQYKCKGKNSNLIVHHIDFDENNNDLKNLITLCVSCHSYFHLHVNKENNAVNSKALKERKNITCEQCKREFEIIVGTKKKFCSNDCFLKAVRHNRTPKEIRAFNNERTKKYYHKHKHEDKWKERVKKNNNLAYEKRKSNPKKLREYLKKQAEYQKKRYANDPEYRERVLKYQKEHNKKKHEMVKSK